MSKVPTSSEVIEALLNAKKPADKAHATRKLRAYATQKVSEGKNERQVVAAIKAHVTRRKKAASA